MIDSEKMDDVKLGSVESVGTVQAVYTVEPHPGDDGLAVVTYWLPGGQRLGTLCVPRQ